MDAPGETTVPSGIVKSEMKTRALVHPGAFGKAVGVDVGSWMLPTGVCVGAGSVGGGTSVAAKKGRRVACATDATLCGGNVHPVIQRPMLNRSSNDREVVVIIAVYPDFLPSILKTTPSLQR